MLIVRMESSGFAKLLGYVRKDRRSGRLSWLSGSVPRGLETVGYEWDLIAPVTCDIIGK